MSLYSCPLDGSFTETLYQSPGERLGKKLGVVLTGSSCSVYEGLCGAAWGPVCCQHGHQKMSHSQPKIACKGKSVQDHLSLLVYIHVATYSTSCNNYFVTPLAVRETLAKIDAVLGQFYCTCFMATAKYSSSVWDEWRFSWFLIQPLHEFTVGLLVRCLRCFAAERNQN